MRRYRTTGRTWTTAIPETTSMLSLLRCTKYVSNYTRHTVTPVDCKVDFFDQFLSVFLNRTKTLTWASLRRTWLCALWICSWLEWRRPPQPCCGPWFTSLTTLISRMGARIHCFHFAYYKLASCTNISLVTIVF